MDADMEKNKIYNNLCQRFFKIKMNQMVIQHNLIEPRYGYSHPFTKKMYRLYKSVKSSLSSGCDGITSADYPLDVEYIKIGNEKYIRLTNMWYGCWNYEKPSHMDGKIHPYCYPHCIENNLIDGYPGNDITQKKPYIKNLTTEQIQFIHAHFENIKQFIKSMGCLKYKRYYHDFEKRSKKTIKQIEKLATNENLIL
jgi:hypothetical protein